MNNTNTKSTEKCVVCGVDTKVPVGAHIDFRHNYVSGAGQCCADCYVKTFG